MKGWYGLQVSQYCTIAKTRFSHDPSGAFGRKRHGGFAGKFNQENTIQETITCAQFKKKVSSVFKGHRR